jgi:hypothetical protein
MMTRRKGELTAAGIDRGWPHQVALPAALVAREFAAIQAFCRDLTLCLRGHSVVRDGAWWRVFCFAEAAHAERFKQRFGGERFDPAKRGRGNAWASYRG